MKNKSSNLFTSIITFITAIALFLYMNKSSREIKLFEKIVLISLVVLAILNLFMHFKIKKINETIKQQKDNEKLAIIDEKENNIKVD